MMCHIIYHRIHEYICMMCIHEYIYTHIDVYDVVNVHMMSRTPGYTDACIRIHEYIYTHIDVYDVVNVHMKSRTLEYANVCICH